MNSLTDIKFTDWFFNDNGLIDTNSRWSKFFIA